MYVKVGNLVNNVRDVRGVCSSVCVPRWLVSIPVQPVPVVAKLLPQDRHVTFLVFSHCISAYLGSHVKTEYYNKLFFLLQTILFKTLNNRLSYQISQWFDLESYNWVTSSVLVSNCQDLSLRSRPKHLEDKLLSIFLTVVNSLTLLLFFLHHHHSSFMAQLKCHSKLFSGLLILCNSN